LIQVIVPEFGTFSAVSDKDGRYEVLLPVQGKNMEAVCTANGDRFETVTLPPITGNAETVLDIYAEVPEA
jgi:hypothetical protein